MSPDQSTPSALYQAIHAAALDAYGSLLAGPLADKAASAFADEAHALLEAMIAEHALGLRERIDAQLTGLSLGKGAKRKGAPKAQAATNGAAGSAAPAAPTAEPTDGGIAAEANGERKPSEAKPKAAEPKAARATETKSTRPRKRAGGRTAAR